MRQSYLRCCMAKIIDLVQEERFVGIHFMVDALNPPRMQSINKLISLTAHQARAGINMLENENVLRKLASYEAQYPENWGVLQSEHSLLHILLCLHVVYDCEKETAKLKPYTESFELLTLDERMLLVQGIPVPVARERSLVCT